MNPKNSPGPTDYITGYVIGRSGRLIWLSLCFLLLCGVLGIARARGNADESRAKKQSRNRETAVSYYAAVKKAAKQSLPSIQHLVEANGRVRLGYTKSYDFYLCYDADDIGVDTNTAAFFVTTIAMHTQVYERDLLALRIPPKIYAADLSSMDSMAIALLTEEKTTSERLKDARWKQLDAAYKKLQKQLLNDVAAYAVTRSDLPKFGWYGECGALGFIVEVQTTPPGGTVSFIPLFKYRLCQALKVDPEDASICEGWETAVSEVGTMAGLYRYAARWPDGRSTRGTVRVTENTAIVNIRR